MLVALEGKPKPSMDGGGVCPKRKRALFGNVRHPKRKGFAPGGEHLVVIDKWRI